MGLVVGVVRKSNYTLARWWQSRSLRKVAESSPYPAAEDAVTKQNTVAASKRLPAGKDPAAGVRAKEREGIGSACVAREMVEFELSKRITYTQPSPKVIH